MKKKQKTIICCLLILQMLAGLTACSHESAADTKTKDTKEASKESPSIPEATGKEKAEYIETIRLAVEKTVESANVQLEPQNAENQEAEPSVEQPEEPAEAVVPEVQVTDLNATMYATQSVNVRSGDNIDTPRIGSLSAGQEVLVTGQSSSSGWYRIDFRGQAGFVSNKYLQNEKPVAQPAEQPQQPNQSRPNAGEKPGSVQQILNSAMLNPTKSGYEPLDTLLDNLLPQLYGGGASTYEKVKACYDYLIHNCSYGSKGGSGAEKAYEMLTSHVGDCSDYSVAFHTMMKAIGLDCKVIALGQTTMVGGGYASHWWCVITINGIEYVFDPQIEDNIAKGGAIQYYRFCKRYDEVPGKYMGGSVYDVEPPRDFYDWEDFYDWDDWDDFYDWEELYRLLMEE